MKKNAVYALLAFLFFLCVHPFLFLGHSFPFENGNFDFNIYKCAITNPMTIRSFWDTMFICGTTFIVGTLISIPLAWLFTRTNVAFKGI